MFVFPKRKFGEKEEERSFITEWFKKLHYDIKSDSAFCYLCMIAAQESKILSHTKRDPAFLTKGFTYW